VSHDANLHKVLKLKKFVKIPVLWDVRPYRWVSIAQRFEVLYCTTILRNVGQYQTPRGHVPEHWNLQQNRYENLRSVIVPPSAYLHSYVHCTESKHVFCVRQSNIKRIA